MVVWFWGGLCVSLSEVLVCSSGRDRRQRRDSSLSVWFGVPIWSVFGVSDVVWFRVVCRCVGSWVIRPLPSWYPAGDGPDVVV